MTGVSRQGDMDLDSVALDSHVAAMIHVDRVCISYVTNGIVNIQDLPDILRFMRDTREYCSLQDRHFRPPAIVMNYP